jgi:hypothetical protein
MKNIFHRFDYYLETILQLRNKKLIFFILVLFFSSLIVVLRRPDMISRPQFYAEDGKFWYSEAYNNGPVNSLFIPKQGYFQTISRLGAFVSLQFSLGKAPLVLNLLAIFLQVLPVLFLLSSRFDKIIPNRSLRIFLGLIYLLLPHSRETHANITNSQWRLAILMFLIIIAESPQKLWWKIFDYTALFVAGLSGPFSVLIFPVFAVHEFFKQKKKWVPLGIVMLTAGTQLTSSFLTMNEQRSRAPLGASVSNFFKIISGHVFLAGLVGSDIFSSARHLSLWINGVFPILFGLFGIGFVAYIFIKSPSELRFFIAFAIIIFAAAIVTPQVSADKPQWEIMAASGGNRYYLLPILVWITSLSWIFWNEKNKFLRILSGIFLACLLFIGIPKEFNFKPFDDFKFQKQIAEFNALSSGLNFEFKIAPKGWRMNLVKK